MNMLEQYIQPGWTMRALTINEKSQFGKMMKLDWVHVDCKADCYGDIRKDRDTWVKQDWLESVKRGYYMA